MNQHINSLVESFGNSASKIAYISAAYTGFIGWIGSSHFAVMTGFIIALATFLIGWHYRHQDNLRSKERHRLDVVEREARIAYYNKNGTPMVAVCEVPEDDNSN